MKECLHSAHKLGIVASMRAFEDQSAFIADRMLGYVLPHRPCEERTRPAAFQAYECVRDCYEECSKASGAKFSSLL